MSYLSPALLPAVAPAAVDAPFYPSGPVPPAGGLTTRLSTPCLWLVGPDGEHVVLPGSLWPEGLSMGDGGPIFCGPMEVREANRLCELWAHPLKGSRRPFHQEAWGLAVDGVAVAAAISATTASTTVNFEELALAPMRRRELVDLARIVRHPDHPGVMRVMLRMWRDYLARRFRGSPAKWGDVPPRRAVSYALPGKEGNLYRFDGWRKVGSRRPSGGGGSWSGAPVANAMADGRKTLWMYDYRTAE